jgi:septation ring formation regulator EzrA
MDKYKQENLNLSDENDLLKRQLDLKDREQFLLNKQVNGLQEDNERINRLYQVVEREAFAGKPVVENKIPQAK